MSEEEQGIACYLDYLPERAEELYLTLLEYFEPEQEEKFLDDEDDVME